MRELKKCHAVGRRFLSMMSRASRDVLERIQDGVERSICEAVSSCHYFGARRGCASRRTTDRWHERYGLLRRELDMLGGPVTSPPVNANVVAAMNGKC